MIHNEKRLSMILEWKVFDDHKGESTEKKD
jgi:hypothetical protein